ncbi:MAG: PqqD family protein, partial [Armatimonadota bacterium]|nr:PqqD family protein [Armatimonadota bacterium]
NQTAYFIWRHCDGTHTPEAIAAALAHHFAGASEHDVTRHTREALSRFLEGGLLVGGGNADT